MQTAASESPNNDRILCPQFRRQTESSKRPSDVAAEQFVPRAIESRSAETVRGFELRSDSTTLLNEFREVHFVTDRNASAAQRADLEERVRALRLPAPAKGAAGSRLPWAAAIFFAGLLIWQIYLARERTLSEDDDEAQPTQSAKESSKSESENRAPQSAASTAQPKRATNSNIVLDSKGHVVPAHQILVSPKVGGMILELFIEEGRRVRKGEILAEVEKIDFEADRDRAEANLLRAQAALRKAQNRVEETERGFRELEKEQSEAELAEAQTELKRLEGEQQRNVDLKAKNAITEKDFADNDAKYRAAKQRVRRLEAALALMREGERSERRSIAKNEQQLAEADVMLARADLAKAQWRLDNCTIRAPINGTILKKNAEIGNIVNPIAPQGSFSLCDMADLADLEVELNIGERDISVIYPGQRCTVRSDAYPDRIYEATVDRLMPIADRAKASIPVRVKVKVPTDEEGVYLKPEMGVNVTFYKALEEKKAEATPPATDSKPASLPDDAK